MNSLAFVLGNVVFSKIWMAFIFVDIATLWNFTGTYCIWEGPNANLDRSCFFFGKLKFSKSIAEKKFFINNFFSKFEQIQEKLQICSHLLKKTLTEKSHGQMSDL